MEEVYSFIDLLKKRKQQRAARMAKIEAEQIREYDQLEKELKNLRAEGIQAREDTIKNLSTLTGHKHSISKMVHDAKNVSGLPISSDHQQFALSFFADASEFIKDAQHIYETLDSSNNDNETRSKHIVDSVVKCTESIAAEVHRAKSSIAQTETLNSDVEFIKEHCSHSFEEDMEELNDSIF